LSNNIPTRHLRIQICFGATQRPAPLNSTRNQPQPTHPHNPLRQQLRNKSRYNPWYHMRRHKRKSAQAALFQRRQLRDQQAMQPALEGRRCRLMCVNCGAACSASECVLWGFIYADGPMVCDATSQSKSQQRSYACTGKHTPRVVTVCLLTNTVGASVLHVSRKRGGSTRIHEDVSWLHTSGDTLQCIFKWFLQRSTSRLVRLRLNSSNARMR
jgi:hypothetical protein